MAGEIQFETTSGVTCYAQIRSATGTVWNTAGGAFEAFNGSNWTDYDIAVVEQGTSGIYIGDVPAGINTALVLSVTGFRRAGGSPAQGDPRVAAGAIEWTGTSTEIGAAGSLAAYDPPTRAEATADKDELLAQLPSSPVKNAAFTYVIKMVDSTDHSTPETGLTITATRSIDGAAFAATTGTVTEISTGHYRFAASAADMNGDFVTHRFTATGADDLTIAMKTVS